MRDDTVQEKHFGCCKVQHFAAMEIVCSLIEPAFVLRRPNVLACAHSYARRHCGERKSRRFIVCGL
jgi:hypothetical protein